MGELPGIGAQRDEVEAGLRVRPVDTYLTLYRQVGGDAEIIRVVHGARRSEGLPR